MSLCLTIKKKVKQKSKCKNSTIYRCDICDKHSNQKSHHILHLESDSHKQNEIIFRLQLEKNTIEEHAR